MNAQSRFTIAVLSGDGIGPEIMAPTLDLLRAVENRIGGFSLQFDDVPAGAGLYRDSGTAFPDTARARARAADAILLAAMGLPDVRYPDGTEISPQLDLRVELDLYAGIRPVRLLPGLDLPLADPRSKEIDLVLVRESTEGLFASHGKGKIENDSTATDTMVITRKASERLFDYAFRLARRRKEKGRPGRVTCVDKANVFTSFAFFRKVFGERAARYEDIEADCSYVDAMALNLVRQPWRFDVLVTENMFGDILSDLGASLMGGMGMAPSADIGDDHAVFQPCHGSAPDIAGSGKANPTAMFLSAAMMLEWLGETRENADCIRGGELIRDSVDQAFAAGGLVPTELGGDAGLERITDAVMGALGAATTPSAALSA